MGKKHIDISIDEETLFLLNQQIRDGERSALFENLARNYLEGLDPGSTNSDEIKLIKEVEKLEDERDKLNVQLSVKKTILKRIRDEREIELDEQKKAELFAAEKQYDMLRRSGFLEEMQDGGR